MWRRNVAEHALRHLDQADMPSEAVCCGLELFDLPQEPQMSRPAKPSPASRTSPAGGEIPGGKAPGPLKVDVVSVQSQVVYGRVGNSVAVPALQAHGLCVAPVPTVVLSNTPHYPSMHGGPIPLDWFSGYLSDLRARGALASLRVILTGYLGSPEQAKALGQWIHDTLSDNGDAWVQIDPVIGDHDHGIYVDPGMVEAYQEHLLPLAHGLTPNGFELECLTGMPVDTTAAVIQAARSLLRRHGQWVVVTSAAPADWMPGEMQVVVVTRDEERTLRHPRIDAVPKGTGDLFGAVLAAGMLGGATVFDAAARACDVVMQALLCTQQAGCAELLLPHEPVYRL